MLVPVLTEHRIEQVAISVDGTVQVTPVTADLDVRLVQIPGDPGPPATLGAKILTTPAAHKESSLSVFTREPDPPPSPPRKQSERASSKPDEASLCLSDRHTGDNQPEFIRCSAITTVSMTYSGVTASISSIEGKHFKFTRLHLKWARSSAG